MQHISNIKNHEKIIIIIGSYVVIKMKEIKKKNLDLLIPTYL